jgi:hypothetical protein
MNSATPENPDAQNSEQKRADKVPETGSMKTSARRPTLNLQVEKTRAAKSTQVRLKLGKKMWAPKIARPLPCRAGENF